MLTIAYYLLKVIICSGILYGYYWLLLRNKIFHKYNRFYLMVSVVLSLLLPLIKINFWQPTAEQPSGVIKVLQAVSNGDVYMDNIIVSTNNETASFDITQLYPFAYLLVSLILLTIFLHTLFAIFNLLKKYPKQTIGKILFVNTDAKSTPFSFLNYIFWNCNIDMETTTGNQIFKHEVAHVQEKHTYDKLFINIVLIFFWCNPFYWLYRKELNMIHEFIADKKAVEDSDTAAFAAMILQATYPQHRFQLTNNFFYSPIKRRLLMLTKNKNPKVNYLGRIMVLPLMMLIFAAFSLKTKPSDRIDHEQNDKDINTRLQTFNPTAMNMDSTAFGLYMLGQYTDTNYIKTSDYKSRALIVLDEKPIGNFGMQHVDSVHIQYNNIIIYNQRQGKKEFGEPGKYGAIRLIQKSVVMIRADKILYDDNTNRVTLKGDNAQLNGDFSDALIYLDGKLISAQQLKEIKPEKISSVNVYKGEKMNVMFGIEKAKVKKAIIAITLKKDSLTEAANLNNNNSTAIFSDTTKAGIYVNTKHADTNYLKSDAFKTKALVIIDAKEMGNVGNNYVGANMSSYSSVVIYNPTEAKKFYGDIGKYGIIKLTQKDAMLITADAVFIDEKNGTVKLSGNNTVIKGNLSEALIYIDGKICTPAQLNAIPPSKISSVSVLKGEKLDEIIEAKGKKAVINVSLKPDDLPEVVVKGYKKEKPITIYNESPIATIAADRMNVLYIGIDNPITIAAPVKPDDLVATISAGKITGGSNGKYIVHVFAPGVVNITLSKKDGTKLPGVFNFKVLRVPDPADKITYSNFEYKIEPKLGIDGIQKVRMAVEQFSKAKKLTAGTGYEVETGTVYFSGANFKNVISVNFSGNDLSKLSEYIGMCVAGSVITFDNVKVKGDNGYYATIDGLSIALYDSDLKKSVTEVYGVPLKVHMMNDGKVNTYHMVGNGAFTTKPNELLYVNGNPTRTPVFIKKENVTAMELYDAGAGKLTFGEKGKHGVLLLTTKG